MKKLFSILFFCALAVGAYAEDKKPDMQLADHTFFDPTKKQMEDEEYHFGVEYRLEVGYVQHEQRTRSMTYPHTYLHGVRAGLDVTFLLPLHISTQIGLYYTFASGKNDQHWRSMTAQSVQEEVLVHRLMEHNLTIPIRMYYTIPLWRKLNLFFFTGPQLHIGLALNDKIQKDLSDETLNWLRGIGVPTENYDRYKSELIRANIQWGLGGGLEWDCYRLQAGYDFGLNNLVNQKQLPNQYMAEWGWFVSFCYRF